MGPPPPVLGAEGAPEHEPQELLKFKMRYGRARGHLVPCRGLDAARGGRSTTRDLTNCEAALAASEHVTGRSLPRRRRHLRRSPTPTTRHRRLDPARPQAVKVVGRTVLYWWSDDGWQRGTVGRLLPRGAF